MQPITSSLPECNYQQQQQQKTEHTKTGLHQSTSALLHKETKIIIKTKQNKTEEVKVVQSSIMQLDQITNKKTHTKLLKIGKNNNQSVKIRQVHK